MIMHLELPFFFKKKKEVISLKYLFNKQKNQLKNKIQLKRVYIIENYITFAPSFD